MIGDLTQFLNIQNENKLTWTYGLCIIQQTIIHSNCCLNYTPPTQECKIRTWNRL